MEVWQIEVDLSGEGVLHVSTTLAESRQSEQRVCPHDFGQTFRSKLCQNPHAYNTRSDLHLRAVCLQITVCVLVSSPSELDLKH